MKLHLFHIAERGDPGLQGDGGWNATLETGAMSYHDRL
jgi:hypothetical protein